MTSWLLLFSLFAFACGWTGLAYGSARRSFHMLQLEEYQFVRFVRWLGRNLSVVLDPWIIGASGLVLAAVRFAPPGISSGVVIIAAGLVIWNWRTRPPLAAKKPLVVTARVKRLIVGYFIVVAVVSALVDLAIGWQRPEVFPLSFFLALSFFAVGVGLWPCTVVANLILYPVEAALRQFYLRSAARILQRSQATVIGIAGSYGKTSTKSFLSQILATRYSTLATPRSFNTPMGLCRVIREQLRPDHRFFVAELGAYERGEIRQLCRLVRPTIGILTSVGPEHLERFGSMENVVRAESELFESLPADGAAFVYGDDQASVQIARRVHRRTFIVGGEFATDRVLWVEHLTVSTDGLRFHLCHRDGWENEVHTGLLGRHNVGNILLAGAVALSCGISPTDLVAAIGRLEPVEHRLQLVPNPNGVVVIDDTYNSNPSGAAAALETLAAFPSGQHILVTPGMVELAEYQDTAHREFGTLAAKVCDRVILVGLRRTKAIAEGLVAGGFAPSGIIVTRDLSEATKALAAIIQPGDTVLFENDLPDNYAD